VKASFTGTVVACCTRFQIKKSTTAYLTHFDANWILTLAIESADPQLPFKSDEVSFAIHSPVQLLFDSAEEAVGKRYSLEVDMKDDGRPEWITLQRARSS
jgi:hypothetical protein